MWRNGVYAEIRTRTRAQGELSIQRMCELASVSRASFYRHWEVTEPSAAEMQLRDAIQREALKDRHYGYRRITLALQKQGFAVGTKTVRRLMQADNLLAIRRRKFVVTTDSEHDFRVYSNLAQHLELTDINQLWVADLTYVWLQREFVYLALLLDAYSRRVIGWALDRKMNTSLPLAALNHAIASRQPQPGLVHHSDRGSQYASGLYVDRLLGIGAVPSMSRPGCPWENGKCESFIKTLKYEQLDGRQYGTLEELRAHVAEFIERIYNPVRLHSALEYQSPLDFERQRASQPRSEWQPANTSFRRHEEIYSDGLQQPTAGAGVAHPGDSSE